VTEKKTEVGGVEEENLRLERRSAKESGRCSAVGDEQRWREWRMSAKGGSMAKMADRRWKKRRISECGRWTKGTNGGDVREVDRGDGRNGG